ncbi:MAG: outer membrane beta-barrel protein [Burkholderiales bacterium]|nr:outer membrane beta-barrel protein [Burkholderiales bacterium]
MHRLVSIAFVCGLAVSAAVDAAGPAATATTATPGFYGGVSLRSGSAPGQGLALGGTGSAWSHYALPSADDAGNRALAYGGYRFANDAALEVAVSTFDRYALAPTAPGARRGVGLALVPAADAPGKAWNVDLYTTWELRRSLALYGRLGYAQNGSVPAPLAGFTNDVRRDREGMNYGVGVRYDLNSTLGLRLEYSRFARLPGEFAPGALPESDQVQVGVQYRF